MIGRIQHCPPNTETPICEIGYVPCQHTKAIKQQFIQESGTREPISLIIDALLELQEEFLEELYGSEPVI